jgi:hypothetical protein
VTARREAFAAAIARLRGVLKAPENDVSRDGRFNVLSSVLN